MYLGKRIAVVIPAHNEQVYIAQTIATLPDFVDVVLVVDDGSQDDTQRQARAAGRPVRVLSHARARGVGSAIVAGYREALRADCDIAVVMAGDGQMCPSDLPQLLLPLCTNACDYAKGDRFRHADIAITMPKERYWVGRALSRLTRAATGYSGLDDSQCGYTAITRNALLRLPLAELWTGYGYPNDLLSQLSVLGLRVQNVVVRPVYRAERSGLRARHVMVIGALIGRAALRRGSKSAQRWLGALASD